jgi:uncharacterized protein YdhG (YjbR/CyaY superfamily)
MKSNNIPATIDEYIAQFPVTIQKKLKDLRATIKKAAPQAEEKISYQMPAFVHKGILVYFAAFTNHIGFYPGLSGVASFKDELSSYKFAKGSIQFPVDKPVPLGLVRKIVIFRLHENLYKAEMKAGKK